MPSAFGGNSTFVPRVTANLIVGYSRDIKKYVINDLVKLVPVDKEIGLFPKRRPQEMSRLGSRDAKRWADGAARQITDYNKDQWEFIEYRCTRYQDAKPIGWKAAKQADFPVIEAQANSLANQFMLDRTKDLFNQLVNMTYLPGNSGTATSFGGGAWSAATTANRFIQKTLGGAAQQIQKQTGGVVRYSDLTLVIGPQLALQIATSQEYAEGLIQSPYALGQLQGKDNWNVAYGIGPDLYGMKVVVDDSVEVTSNQNAAGTATPVFIPLATEAYIIARPGDLVNKSGQFDEFSTFGLFAYEDEEMLTEQWDDPVNKRTLVGVTDTVQIKPVAIETAAKINVAA